MDLNTLKVQYNIFNGVLKDLYEYYGFLSDIEEGFTENYLDKFSCEFDLENCNSFTFKSYFKNIDIEWIYPDIESTLENEKYGYKVFLEDKKIIVSW